MLKGLHSVSSISILENLCFLLSGKGVSAPFEKSVYLLQGVLHITVITELG